MNIILVKVAFVAIVSATLQFLIKNKGYLIHGEILGEIHGEIHGKHIGKPLGVQGRSTGNT